MEVLKNPYKNNINLPSFEVKTFKTCHKIPALDYYGR
jgi:hypothetical protein